jgi:hypothetical protein
VDEKGRWVKPSSPEKLMWRVRVKRKKWGMTERRISGWVPAVKRQNQSMG